MIFYFIRAYICIQSIRFTQFIIDADIVFVKTNLIESNFTLAGFKAALGADSHKKRCILSAFTYLCSLYMVMVFSRANKASDG